MNTENMDNTNIIMDNMNKKKETTKIKIQEQQLKKKN